ncbi:hypothetical protein BDW02DRAFT_571120 [Decorospora gaudefroyi]|uniref:Uncharacterized protein n=1 Tax=Decorospora gaudefroyi TaxID=184978 RepID=A0A6A5K3W6_9PLEO|nr:hypothetical protein BDW02DRAFT_571120 [Decorospora gaudefroyi]
MLAQAKYDGVRERLRAIKKLYASRHYTQCAHFGEQLLREMKDDIDPIHLAYLNFYTALSHDTLAREATLKNRQHELSAAEEYYSAAIAALAPLSPSASTPSTNDEQPPTPTLATFQDSGNWRSGSPNTKSFDSNVSCRSSTSSATSYAFDLEQDPDLALKNFRFPTPPQRDVGGNLSIVSKSHAHHVKNDSILSPLSIEPPRPQTPQESKLAAGISIFVCMLEGHLSSVRNLKGSSSMHGVRFALPSPQRSPTKSRLLSSRNSPIFNDVDKQCLRQKRSMVEWRPRFDPESVRRLCREALTELS